MVLTTMRESITVVDKGEYSNTAAESRTATAGSGIQFMMVFTPLGLLQVGLTITPSEGEDYEASRGHPTKSLSESTELLTLLLRRRNC